MNRRAGKLRRILLMMAFVCVVGAGAAPAQRARAAVDDDAEFGPVMRTYLGYLRAEQEVVDDRVSRREVSQSYYRRNSNRIRALRQMAVRVVRETRNDFVPELYAVTRDELGTLFDPQPRPETFSVGEVVEDTFRYLGTVRAAEPFYLFARLDVYEQAERLKAKESRPAAAAIAPDEPDATNASRGSRATTRPRRVHIP